MKRALPLVIAALLIAGCGGDDGEDRERERPAPGAAVFRSERVGFTFHYPKRLAVRKPRKGGVLGQVSLRRDARVNAIKVRKTADQELRPARYLPEFQRDFEESVRRVEKGRTRAGDLDLAVLEFDHSARLRGRRVRFRSTSYFFAGGGKTWQLECIAARRHRKRMEEPCKLALRTIEFSD